MKFLGALFAATVLGDTCYQSSTVAMNFRLSGNVLQVTAQAMMNGWVGFGVPAPGSPGSMANGDFVMGGPGGVFDYTSNSARNIKPNVPGTNGFIPGTQSTNTANGVTMMSFQRQLSPPGYWPSDPSQPFNILWGSGSATGGGYAGFQYHGRNRGTFVVDLTSPGNCDPGTAATLSAAAGPRAPVTTGKKGKKGGKKGKKASACANGSMMCTSALQAQGANCIVGMCFPAPSRMPMPAACMNGQTMCTAALQAQGANCIVGTCFQAPMMGCPAGSMMCTAALQAQGSNCVVGFCFQAPGVALTVGIDIRSPNSGACPNGQVMCTAMMQAQGANCIVNMCTPAPGFQVVCPSGQTVCTSALQATGMNCILNACVNAVLGMGG